MEVLKEMVCLSGKRGSVGHLGGGIWINFNEEELLM